METYRLLNEARFPDEKFYRCINCLRPIWKLNHSIIGSIVGNLSPRAAMDNPQDSPKSTDWCAEGGQGCIPWKKSEQGIARYKDLYVRWQKLEDNKARLSQLAEESDLKSVQSRFESEDG